MRRVILGELLHRRSRTLALLLGIVVATTCFTVLTGASSTQRLEVRGEVSRSFRTAYDVLVRPAGSRTERAARAQPIAAVRPAVLPVGHRRRIRRLAGLAVTDLLRVPGRALLGALSVAIGVCALTLLLAATVAFNDTLVGTLLGDAVAVEGRTTDYVAVGAMVLLGAAAVADVLFLNVRDRAAELATLRATGWSEGAMTRLVGYEGLMIGAVGSVAGACLGVAGVAEFTDALPRDLLATALLAAAAGTVLAGLAALAPAAALRRLAPAPLLAAD